MDDRVLGPLDRTEDRSVHHFTIPDVLCKQLVLHLASVPFFTLSCFIAGGTLKRIRYFGYSEFNDFNGALFNIRTRSLNNLVYWLAQILGSGAMGFLLDQRGLSRRVRAFSGWCVLLIMVLVVHIWAYFYQKYVSCPS